MAGADLKGACFDDCCLNKADLDFCDMTDAT